MARGRSATRGKCLQLRVTWRQQKNYPVLSPESDISYATGSDSDLIYIFHETLKGKKDEVL